MEGKREVKRRQKEKKRRKNIILERGGGENMIFLGNIYPENILSILKNEIDEVKRLFKALKSSLNNLSFAAEYC